MRKTTLLPSSSRVAVIAVCPAASFAGALVVSTTTPSFACSFSCFGSETFGCGFSAGFSATGLLSLLFLLRGLFLGYGLLRLFRKRIGRRNFTHRGRCGLFRRDSGIGCGSRRFGRILTRRSFLIGRDRRTYQAGPQLPRSVPLSRGTRTPPLFPSESPREGSLGRAGISFEREPVTICLRSGVHPEHGIPTPRARREKA